MQKQLEGTQKYINEQVDRVALLSRATHAIIDEQYTRASAEYKCLK